MKRWNHYVLIFPRVFLSYLYEIHTGTCFHWVESCNSPFKKNRYKLFTVPVGIEENNIHSPALKKRSDPFVIGQHKFPDWQVKP